MEQDDSSQSSGFGRCCICGEERKLTFEHLPPKQAFNQGGGRTATMDQLIAEGRGGKTRYSKSRKGFGKQSLCGPCNNNTGYWYVPAYIGWAHQGMRFLDATGSLAMPFHIFPARVAKQVIAMFASTNGAGFFDAHPRLRKFVLDRDARGIPEDIRLYTYLSTSNTNVARSTGVVAMMDLRKSTPSIFSEFAFMPFGYILSVDSPPPATGLFDMTFFCDHGYNDYRDLHLPISAREVHTYFPADFRSKDEWESVQARSRAERLAAALRGDPV